MMKSNGKIDRKQLITIIRMLMYLVDEAQEKGLTRTAETLQAELDELRQEYQVTKTELFPNNDN